MSRVASTPFLVGERTMARKRTKDAAPEAGESKPAEGAPALRQVNLRLDPAYFAQVQHVADVLGLEVTQLLRMVIRENFGPYQARADLIERSLRRDSH